MIIIMEHTFQCFNSLVTNFIKFIGCMNCAELTVVTNYIDSYPVIAREAYFWYLKVIDDNRIELEEEDQNVERVAGSLKEIIKMYLRNQIILDDIFTRAWGVSYCKITSGVLDQVVSDIIKPIVKHVVHVMEDPRKEREVKESLKMLHLYHSVRNLVNYVNNDLASSRNELCMDGYSGWFGEDLILEWFLLCNIYTQPFIERAVTLDSMERLSEDITHGTSVPDVASVVDEIVIDVWMKLKWDDQFYTHGALTEAIRTCVNSYVKAISTKIEEKHFFCDKNQFIMKEKLCVALSNVYAMFDHLHITKGKIQTILCNTEAEYGFTIIDPIANVESQMQINVANAFHKVLRQVSSRFRRYTRRMVRNRAMNQSSTLADACSYIESTLETMYLNWKSELFYIVLRHMWIIVVVNLNESLKCCKGSFMKWNKKPIYLIILQAIGQLQSIFYCDGHGLSYPEMTNTIFLDMKMKIERKLKTTD